MITNETKELLLSLLCDSDTSSDEDDGLCEIFTMLEEQKLLFPKTKVASTRRKRCRSSTGTATPTTTDEEQADEPKRSRRMPMLIDTKPQIKNYLDELPEEILIANLENWQQLDEQEFCKLFRLPRDCFQQLLSQFEQFEQLEELPPNIKEVKHSKMLLLFLAYAGHQITIRALTQKFKVFRNCFLHYVECVLDFLLSLEPTTVSLPHTEAQQQQSAAEFQQIAGLQNILGCIERLQFCSRPQVGKLRFTYGNIYKIPTQMICDARGRILLLDADILDTRLDKVSACNKYCFLGSAKFSLREWIITPCQLEARRHPTALQVDQLLFNEKFEATYAVMSQTLEQFLMRFQQLIGMDIQRLAFARRLLLSCAVLHNLALDSYEAAAIDVTPPSAREVAAIKEAIIEMTNDDEHNEHKLFSCVKGVERRERMIYESCIFGAMLDGAEQEIVVG